MKSGVSLTVRRGLDIFYLWFVLGKSGTALAVPDFSHHPKLIIVIRKSGYEAQVNVGL